MRGPGRPCARVATLAVLAILLAGCAEGRFQRAFGYEYDPRPPGSPVAVTVDAEVDEEDRLLLGIERASAAPLEPLIGRAEGDATSLPEALEALREQARLLGGDVVHVDDVLYQLGKRVSGFVYRRGVGR